MSVTNMMWQPQLVRLTFIPHPKLSGGKSTSCFIDPRHICVIKRTETTIESLGQEQTQYGEATLVMINDRLYLHVEESPETVAMLRDKALGHAPKLEAA